MSPRSCSSSPPLFLLLLLSSDIWSYEDTAHKVDVYAIKPCAAFLSFTNAAYLRGATVELPCYCKPLQVQSVVWFYKKYAHSSEETIALTDHHGNKLLDNRQVPHSSNLQSRFSIRLFNLLIFRTGLDDSGIYICGSAKKDFFYAYDVDIQEAHTLSFASSDKSFSIHHAGLDSGGSMLSGDSVWTQRQTGSHGSPQAPFRLFTRFKRWSVCDRCGVPGEQVRVALCYIQSNYLHVRYRGERQTVASCGSGAVPRVFGLSEKGRGGAKMEIRTCQETCPPSDPPPPKRHGLMEFVFRATSRPAELPVLYLNHPADQVLTLGCPGARPYLAVAWDRGSKPIYRSEHMLGLNESTAAPRVQIDTGHHLIFRPARSHDSGVYYCWLHGQRVAEIRLLVFAHFGRVQSVTSHPNFYPALRTVLKFYVAMTIVFCLLVFGRAGYKLYSDTTHTKLN